jgi:hypothetical protein
MVYASLRIGLYEPVRNLIIRDPVKRQNPGLLSKIVAGFITGAIGIYVANPTDVVKIRL